MKIRVFERLVDIMIELINVKERKHYEKKTYITMDKENYQTCYLYAIVRQKNDDGYLKLELLKRIYTREEFIKKYNEFFRNDIICYGLEKLNEEKREKIYELSVSEIQNTKFRYLIDFLIDVNDYQIKNNIVDIPDYDLYKIKWKYAPSEIVKDIEKINFQVQDINNMISTCKNNAMIRELNKEREKLIKLLLKANKYQYDYRNKRSGCIKKENHHLRLCKIKKLTRINNK